MNPDGTNPRRLTENTDGDGFPALSPDGKRVVFESNRNRVAREPLNTSDLFLMKSDGKDQTHLTRGSSATWSPDSRKIAFHASASGTGLPIKPDRGAATSDSDIFAVNVGDLLDNVAGPKNLTNTPTLIEDDPDWSPDGQKIVYTRHLATDDHRNSVTAGIYVINADGTGAPQCISCLPENAAAFTVDREERAPAWSPDGTLIAFMCRIVDNPNPLIPPGFEICVMNADGTGLVVRLTTNTVPDLTPTWSPDGQQIAFHRPVSGRIQIFRMNANGTGETQLTNTVGLNGFANWGELRVLDQGPAVTPTPTSTLTAQLNPGAAVTQTPTKAPTGTPAPVATSTPTMTPTRTPTMP